MSRFEKELAKVTPHERLVLQCLSIFWEPITSADIYKLLRALGIKTPEGRMYQANFVSDLKKSLSKKGLIGEIWFCGVFGVQIPSSELREMLMREAMAEPWALEVAQIIQSEFNSSEYNHWYGDSEPHRLRILRDYRLNIYLPSLNGIAKVTQKIKLNKLEGRAAKLLPPIFCRPFQREFLASFDQSAQVEILPILFDAALQNLESTTELWDFVREHDIYSDEIESFRLDELIYKGEITAAKELLGEPNTFHKMIAGAVITFLEKNYEEAIIHFESAIKFWKKILNKKKGFPDSWQMFLYGLALYKTNETKFFTFAEEFFIYAAKNYPEISTHKAVYALESFLRNKNKVEQITANQITADSFAHKIVECLVSAIIPSFKVPVYMKEFLAANQYLGHRWFELELQNLLSLKDVSDSKQALETREIARNLAHQLGFEPVGNSIPQIEDWERVLKVLNVVAENIQGKLESLAKVNEMRVAWHLNFDRKEIQPVEQKYGKTGWSNGRNIALKRLYERGVKNLTDQDISVVRDALQRNLEYSYYGSDYYDFDWQKALAALVGHPNLFLIKNPTVNVQLVRGEPALVVREINDSLELSFDTKIGGQGYLVKKETEARYKVFQITQQHVDIAASLQNNKVMIPRKGRESLMKAIQRLSSKISIQSDLEEHFENLPSVESENRIHALITPLGDGFHLEFFVKPFGTSPPYFKPGKGTESIIADIENVRTRTKRNLSNERSLLDEIEDSCPFLAESESGNYEWELKDAAACLTAMIELERPRTENKLVIEWTKGQKLKLLGNINFGNLSVNVKGNNTWFDVTGEVKIDEDLVLSMQEITKLLGDTTNNFIELSDGQFVAITAKLRKHLQSLSAVMDDKNRLHNLRSGILEEFSEELENFKTDKAWKDHLTKLKNAQKFVPELPATFEAELRPYQIEGFEWLSRLANWGVGACLADDMGLGKTLMALAELVERAEKGPALVVAPVSVCRNWVKEALRFAPTLNFQIFGAGDRTSAVEGLGKYDVLVTSYSLLQAEEELFTGRTFATIVLDEAQAVKNRNTKRSKTVMALRGDFRLITTGTPIENHLGELWNLFNFINPGLLGSHEFFNTKFAAPIEKNNDDDSRKTLQRLIKPFTLRRRKNQVLDDLPAKTEIVLNVEMSPEERAFYESIRRDALQKIEATGGEAKDKRFQILAELTRLRLACCHPQLVNPDIPLSSSKLELFGETLGELLDNKHKALVFSQFVKHLKIVEQYLKEKGIPYHYLDGSTPAHIRQERIDDFQRGSSDVFLISLKAGGTGLNLTAADYVIHLDPWWNPAVEDQATDRVHRIGQQRPVTVYRLVTENTVEEKILKLHETKRDLADSLLDGTDSSSKLSAADLLTLISEA